VPSIASLRLIDFRSYAGLDAAFETGTIALYGPNGAGKTNLLEAISLLSPGRGLRRAKVNLLARVENGETRPAWGINAAVQADDEDDLTRISIGQVPEQVRPLIAESSLTGLHWPFRRIMAPIPVDLRRRVQSAIDCYRTV